MHVPSFRSGFTLIAVGCILFALVLLDRLLYGIEIGVDGAASATANFLTIFYWVGEKFAVLLVSLGLLLPRMARQLKHRTFAIQVRLPLLEVRPIWNRVASNQHK